MEEIEERTEESQSVIDMSIEIIKYLKRKHNMALPHIVKLAGATENFLLKIEEGEETFTLKHLVNMKDKISAIGDFIEGYSRGRMKAMKAVYKTMHRLISMLAEE